MIPSNPTDTPAGGSINPSPNPPSGTVTFLFTDIEASTKLAQQFPGDWGKLQQRHHAILQAAIEAHDGNIFLVIGDAFCAAFHTAGQALRAAYQAQTNLFNENWAPVPIKVRMGIHIGTAELQPDGQYQGYLTLSRLQRLMSAGHGGQVLLSLSIEQLVRESLPEGVILKDLGQVRLKDFSQPEQIFQLVIPGLPADFPPLRSQSTNHTNLPNDLTSFIGRERVLADIETRLSSVRLLTLIGPGGTGKTRLSIQVGRKTLSDYSDGVWLVELAPLADPALIPQAVASVFNLRESPDSTLTDLLTDYLRAKRLLLILDNCEHLIDACSRLAEKFLLSCPNLVILASSREALGVSGESTYRVPSLSLPEPAQASIQELAGCESVQLFLERAAAANPEFQLSPANAVHVAQICRRLDGIPLAIELAAARARVLSPEQIASRLDDRFRLLTGGSRTALPRQQTLRALIDWSYDLLTSPEQALFRRLAVFVSGWTLEAAESVCSGDGLDAYDILDLLTELVDKSLVTVEESHGQVRYHRLETIRQYAREKLLQTDEAANIRHRHLEYFSQLVQAADQAWSGPGSQEIETRLMAEYDNLRAAMAWMLENRLEHAQPLLTWTLNYSLWLKHGYITEGRDFYQAFLERIEGLLSSSAQPSAELLSLKASALDRLANSLMNIGDHLGARAAAEQSVALSRQSNDWKTLAVGLSSYAIAALYSGSLDSAVQAAHESLDLCQQFGFAWEKVWSYLALKHIAEVQGDQSLSQHYQNQYKETMRSLGLPFNPAEEEMDLSFQAFQNGHLDQGKAHANNALAIMIEQQDKYNFVFFQSSIAHTLRKAGDLEAALDHYRSSIRLWQEFGHRAAVVHQLECFAYIAGQQNQRLRAAQLLGAADFLRQVSSSVRVPEEQIEFDSLKSSLQSSLSSTEFQKIWQVGSNMSLEAAVDFALHE